MNIHIDYANLLPRPIKNLKNQDYLPNKLKPLNIETNQADSHLHFKENEKINNLKHDFKTPAIVHSHKLPKAFNSNFTNVKSEPAKPHKEIKFLENNNNQDTTNKLEETEIKKNIFILEKKNLIVNKKNPPKRDAEIKLDKIEQRAFKPNNNPIIPLKNFFKFAKLNENEFFQESPTVKIIESRCNKLEVKKPQSDEKPQMNEMVTISIINSNSNTNQIKIMLHVPSLKPYAIREESLMDIENFHLRKKFLSNWQNLLNRTDNFLHIYDIFWNYPEGFTSTICDVMRGGSLKDLLSYGGSLNETMMKNLSIFLLKSYKDFSHETKTNLGTISLSQILFDEHGNIKIGPTLSNNKGDPFQKMSDYNNWRAVFSKIQPISEYQNVNNNSQSDIFEIGLILLYCAIGDIELFENNGGSGALKKNSNINNEEIKESMFLKSDTNFLINDRKKELKTLENNLQIEFGASCCLLHLFFDCCDEKKLKEFLKKNHSSNFFKTFCRKNGILVKKILEKKYSVDFLEFLCECLSFDLKNKPSYENLLAHKFLHNKCFIKNEITLKEITKISSNWNLNQSSYVIKDKIAHILQSICIVLEEKEIKRRSFFNEKNMEKLAYEMSCSLGISIQTITEMIMAHEINMNT